MPTQETDRPTNPKEPAAPVADAPAFLETYFRDLKPSLDCLTELVRVNPTILREAIELAAIIGIRAEVQRRERMERLATYGLIERSDALPFKPRYWPGLTE